MPYDEVTAERVRRILAQRTDVEEKRIVGGGLGFLVRGHLCCGVGPRGLTVRVGAAGREEALAQEHVGPLQLGSRSAAAFVVVKPEGYAGDDRLAAWVERALRVVATLPPKAR